MIDALSLFFGPPGDAALGNGQPGDIWSDKSKTSGNPSDNPFAKILRDRSAASSLLKNLHLTAPSGKPSDNPFAKILRDQSAASFLPKSLQFTLPSGDQKQLSALEALLGNRDLSQQGMGGEDIPVEVLREIASRMVESPLSVDAQPNPYPANFLESAGKGLKDLAGGIPTPSIPLPSLEANGKSRIGETEIPKAPMGVLPGGIHLGGQLSGAVMLPQVSSAGGPGADGIQAKATIKTAGLPFLTGYSPVQEPTDGRSLPDTSVTHIATNSDRQPLFRDAVTDISRLAGTSDGNPAPGSAGELGKNGGNPLDRISSPVQDGDMRLRRISPPPAVTPQGSLGPLFNQAFHTPLPYEATSAGIADVVQSSQGRVKDVNGVLSVLSESSGIGKEPSLAIPSDLLGDSSLSLTGDRSTEVLEATGKSVGIDPNGGQDINNGMGGSTHSQPGFQQSSSSHSLGSGVRMAEERAPDLPTPPLQRLQMDVQLSETNRIQIDVGVQQRQVYAGLLMDHATLKNLAVQFVPQLENQLAQVDMDLQEFSAEVRDQHGGQESDTSSQWSKTQQVQRGTTPLLHAPESLPSSGKRVEEPGFYLVA